jgi:EmrB/QacA subfamily drug resistance transporter
MTTTATHPAAAELTAPPPLETDPHHARRWLILAVLGLAQLMVVLDATIVNIALPTAQQDLGFSDGNRQWIVTAYSLAFGSLLLLSGRLADLFGRKWMFLIGLAGFAAASAVGGAATSFAMLVGARAVQGVFGAVMAPAGLALLTTTFAHSKERSRAFGIYGAIAGAGGAVGLLLGGLLTEYLSWRWCMYINVFFAAIAFLGATVLLHHQRAGHRPSLEIPGTVTVSLGLFGLVYGFSHAETDGWTNTITLASLIAGAVLLACFVAIQARVAHPLLPLRVLADRNRSGSYLAIFIVGAGMFGIFLFLTYYLQQILGYSSVKTGVAFLPMVGLLMITSTLSSSVLATRISPRVLIATGMVAAAAGMTLLTGVDTTSSYTAHVLPSLLILGAGLGLIFSSAMSMGTLGVAADDSGVASATVNTAQQVGGSIGTALLNTIATSAATHYLSGKAANPNTLTRAAVHSYTTAFWWAAAIFAIGAVLCGLLLKPGIPARDADAAPTIHM